MYSNLKTKLWKKAWEASHAARLKIDSVMLQHACQHSEECLVGRVITITKECNVSLEERCDFCVELDEVTNTCSIKCEDVNCSWCSPGPNCPGPAPAGHEYRLVSVQKKEEADVSNRLVDDVNDVDDIDQRVKKILGSAFWLKDIEVGVQYYLLHDDDLPEEKRGIAVEVGPDGDLWVTTPKVRHSDLLRYRMPLIGGSLSPRTRNALLILALAIKLDNEGHSSDKEPGGE